MRAASEVVGAVLAGGASRRMGADKARLELAGSSLGERAVETLRTQMEEVVVVSRELGDHADLGAPEIADLVPGKGPLGGLNAALDHARGRPVFLLACDLPVVGPELVAYLLESALPVLGDVGAVVPTLGGRTQPLCGVYAAVCQPELEQRLTAGELRVLELVEAVGPMRVELHRELAFYRDDLLDNVNDPEAAGRLGVQPVGSVE